MTIKYLNRRLNFINSINLYALTTMAMSSLSPVLILRNRRTVVHGAE